MAVHLQSSAPPPWSITTPTHSNAIPLTRSAIVRPSLFSPSLGLLLPRQPLPPATPKFTMRAAAKQAYICRDCGYIYNEKTPFEKKPDSYFCPVCGAPKRRFKPYQPAVTKGANDLDVRKARKEQLKRDESIGNVLPYAVIIGAAALAGLYLYLNNAY